MFFRIARLKIYIAHQTTVPHLRPISQIIKHTLKQLYLAVDCSKSGEASIIFVGDRTMRALNRVYRNKDKSTNVLAFPSDIAGDLGDIFISYPQAMREAKVYKLDIQAQIKRLALHGFLHLLGYDHRTAKERQVMERLEAQILC